MPALALRSRNLPTRSLGVGSRFAQLRTAPRLGDLLTDLEQTGSNIVNTALNAGASAGKDAAGDELTQLLQKNEPQLLDAIESKAHDGAVQAAKENAPWLIGLTVTGGAVGGLFLGRMGPLGLLIGLAGGAFCAYKVAQGGQSSGK